MAYNENDYDDHHSSDDNFHNENFHGSSSKENTLDEPMQDAASAFLAKHGYDDFGEDNGNIFDDGSGESVDHMFATETAETHLVDWASKQSTQTQRAMYQILQMDITGNTVGKISPSDAGTMAFKAQESLAHSMGSSTSEMARALKRELGGDVGGNLPERDFRVAYGLMTEKAEGRLTHGSIYGLAGVKSGGVDTLTEDIGDITGKLSNLAANYMTTAARDFDVSGVRQSQISGALQNWFMDAEITKRVRLLPDGSPDLNRQGEVQYNSAELPTPQELGIGLTGLKATQGSWIKGHKTTGGHLGTPFQTNLEYDKWLLSDDAHKYSVVEQMQLRPDAVASIKPKGADFVEFANDIRGLRKSIREVTVKERDASDGRQLRSVGLDSADADQNSIYGKLDESLRGGQAFSSGLTKGKNIDAGDWIDNDFNEKDNDIYGAFNNMPQPQKRHAQGTAGWLAERKGNVTASVMSTMVGDIYGEGNFGSEVGVLQAALDLRSEDMGFRRDLGSAYSARGNSEEDTVRRAFLKTRPDLSREEAFFEKSPSKNFGVSPDDRLYNVDGSSAGLAEYKYLSNTTIHDKKKSPLDTYQDQMQFQMLVTGEDRVNFAVMNADTGELTVDVVEANYQRQAELQDLADEVLAVSSTLDKQSYSNLSVKVMEMKAATLEQARNAKNISAEAKKAENDTFKPTKKAAPVYGAPFSAAGSVLGQQLAKEELRAMTSAANKSADTKQQQQGRVIGEDRSMLNNVDRGASRAQALPMESLKDMNEAYAAEEALDTAAMEAAKSVRSLGDSAGKAAKVMQEIGGAILGGSDSGMDEVQRAAEMGISVERSRGIRSELESGGVRNAKGIMSQAAAKSQKLSSVYGATEAYKSNMEYAYTQGSPSVIAALEKFGPDNMVGMSSDAYLATAQDAMQGLGDNERRLVAKQLGLPDLAAYESQTGKSLWNVEGVVSEENQRGFKSGYEGVKQFFQGAKEIPADLTGKKTGVGVAAGTSAAAIGTSATGAAIAGTVAIKGASVLAGPAVAAATLAPTVARHLSDIKDDGGMADSAMDVADFMSYGAGAGATAGLLGGPLAPLSVPLGAGAGALVGGAIGLANEGYEYMTGKGKDGLTSNVNVEVTVDGTNVKTEVDDNGVISLDEENGVQ